MLTTYTPAAEPIDLPPVAPFGMASADAPVFAGDLYAWVDLVRAAAEEAPQLDPERRKAILAALQRATDALRPLTSAPRDATHPSHLAARQIGVEAQQALKPLLDEPTRERLTDRTTALAILSLLYAEEAASMVKELDEGKLITLTEAQRTALAGLRKTQKARFAKLDQADIPAMRAHFHTIRSEALNVLTPEQRTVVDRWFLNEARRARGLPPTTQPAT